MIDQIFGRGFGVILLSIYAALILTIIPMGDWLAYFRPSWVLLIAIFWSQVIPARVGLWYGFIIGLLLDLLLDKPLGLTAISLVLVLYLQLLFDKQLRVLRGFQQMLKIIVFTFLYLLVHRVLEEFFGQTAQRGLAYWLPILSNSLLWPWFFMFMEGIKSRSGIYESNS